MTDYKGIKIVDKIIIVERTSITEGGYNWKGRTVNQGYVVDYNNAKMLESALCWAEWIWTDPVLRNAWRAAANEFGYDSPEAKAISRKYDDSAKKMEGVVHEYENGTFTITLDEAAEMSSQGGKLSFWTCIITAPDGNNFLIGINSELLLHLLMANTFINGVCQKKVWLGRVKGSQVGVFTEDMEDFKQAKIDEEQRVTMATSTNKYVPGDIVKTLTTKELYMGTAYQYYSFERGYGYYDKFIVLCTKPKLVHIFRNFYKPWNSDEEELSQYFNTLSTKPKRIVAGHIDQDKTAAEYIEERALKNFQDSMGENGKYSWQSAFALKMFGSKNTCDIDEIKNFLTDIYNKCNSYCTHLSSEYKFITDTEYNRQFK